MWCWHRIRESETGLCPACRTPYGEDPHQFTALDVEEVLKANKEAQAAAKRERHLMHHQTSSGVHVGVTPSETAGGGDPDHLSSAAMDIPKDRTQLANMRVIRRNLIYAVGLPPAIANEDTLRKPEYFGQYGKIAKIVLNRSQTVPPEGGDPRRASASAYVTFQHKEDTLACILALDGFYLENRNIRASYGTSKYCSAFIKNVRCNNPECTYLHDMGAAEDTFTKQEIQAGYVTSGRDVLARQQQIVAEQLQQQLQSASGGHHLPPRKRVGGGGPSGTGKASAHPVFPPPEFDEPARQAPPVLPASAGISRTASLHAAITPYASHQVALLNPATISAKMGRSASVGSAQINEGRSQVVEPHNPLRKSQPLTVGTSAATTAASVVAGGRSLSKDSSESHHLHSTLTALTPLKRSSVKAGATTKVPAAEEKLPAIRNGKKQNGARAVVATTKAPEASSTAKDPGLDPPKLLSLIEGDQILPPLNVIGNATAIGMGVADNCTMAAGSLAELGGVVIPIPAGVTSSTATRSSAATLLGGDIFTGSLRGQMNSTSSVVGSSLRGVSSSLPAVGASASSAVGDGPLQRGGNAGQWGVGPAPGPSSNGVIGSHISNNSGSGNSTSALASILGINLPTGSGSLQESSSLWCSTTHVPPLQGPSPLSMLNRSAIQQSYQQSYHHPGGTGMVRMGGSPQLMHNGSSLIGGVPIGGGSSFNGPGTIGAGVVGSNPSDIALLQSLLPGVHITSDNSRFGGSNSSWGAAPIGHPQNLGSSDIVGGNPLLHTSGNWVGGGNSSRLQPSTGSVIGEVGQNNGQQNHSQASGIW